MADKLSHLNAGGEAEMVDVSAKEETRRTATATGRIAMGAAAFAALQAGNNKKGDVLGAARIAGIMATKQTASLIPLCHPLLTEKAAVEFRLLEQDNAVEALCTVQTHGKTGVEMEALSGVTVALLTIYDMCKAVDKGMEITGICLLEKQGGKSGPYKRKAKGV